MDVRKLIKRLQLIEDVNIETQVFCEEDANYWLSDIEVSDTGSSGYEMIGEVRLIGVE